MSRALFAAAAVTGRRLRKAATGAAVGSTLLLAACSSPSVKEETSQTTEENTTSEEAEASGPSCIDPDGGVSSYACCAEHGFNEEDGTFLAEGCQACDEGEFSSCLTCVTTAEESAAGPPMGTYDPECCNAVNWDYSMGCMAWGPPAPPAWAGHRIEDILGPLHTQQEAA